jgi:ribonuclease R
MKKLNELDLRILSFIKAQEGVRVPFEVLAAALDIVKASEVKRLKKYINRLVASRYLKRSSSGLLEIPPEQLEAPAQKPSKPKSPLLTLDSGTLQMNRFGVGFVRLPGHEKDIRIPQKYLGTALPGDLVEVQPFPRRGQDKPEGKITRILQRSDRKYVGVLIKSGKNHFYIQPDPQSVPVDFYIKPEHLNKAKEGDKVVFKLLQWEFKGGLPEAIIIESLGKSGTNDAEILSLLASNQLSNTFPDAVEQEAARIDKSIKPQDLVGRKDLRNDIVFTIDPYDAKDFDDALSVELLNNGHWYLGVHIADVSHYVKMGTALDQEAIERATSVYLVDRVIPMLPEVLSNGVCSLVPHEDRLTFSCFMEVNREGRVLDYEITESVIHSKRRYTYEEAQEIIEGKPDIFAPQLLSLAELSTLLTQQRLREGAIDFDTPEPRFRLDEKGFPTEVHIKERLLSHRLIEECMLLANKTVSEHIAVLRSASKKKDPSVFPFLYRVHDQPDKEKLMSIADLVGPLGIRVKFGEQRVLPTQINELIEQIKGTSVERIISELMLRSMAKAVYSPENIGHFGLHFSDYTHFTSPIRRYPDVIVHRLLKKYAQGGSSYSYEELIHLGQHCSEMEKSAQNAERDSIKLKQVEYLSKRVGQKFKGVISGVTEFGIFVVLDENYCEGLIRVTALEDDFYVYDQRKHRMVGRRRGKILQLGDYIHVIVSDVSLEQRQVYFLPTKPQ